MIAVILKILCYGIAVFALLHTLIGYLLLWIDQRPERLRPREPSTRDSQAAMGGYTLGQLKSAALEWPYQLLEIFSFPLAFFYLPRPIRMAESRGIPVLCIHGYLSHRLIWSWLLYHLAKKPDIGPLYTLNLWPPFAPLSLNAESVIRKIREIQADTGATQVILVGHSMGGLVAALAEGLSQAGSIAKVVTLGTPFKGTALAALGIGENAQAMLKGSAFLDTLEQRLANSTTPYYCIASKMDQEIIPWQSAIYPPDLHARQMLILEETGHLGLLCSPTVLEQLYQWLRS